MIRILHDHQLCRDVRLQQPLIHDLRLLHRNKFIALAMDSTALITFMLSLSAIWFGTTNAAKEIVKELPIYRRERMVNLGILPYVASKALVLGVLATIQ